MESVAQRSCAVCGSELEPDADPRKRYLNANEKTSTPTTPAKTLPRFTRPGRGREDASGALGYAFA